MSAPSETTDAATSANVRLPDGGLTSPRDAPIGGQAVLEGVMMRGVSTWAVAVRKPVSPNGSQANGDGAGAAGTGEDGGRARAAGEHHRPQLAIAPAGGLDATVVVAGEPQ